MPGPEAWVYLAVGFAAARVWQAVTARSRPPRLWRPRQPFTQASSVRPIPPGPAGGVEPGVGPPTSGSAAARPFEMEIVELSDRPTVRRVTITPHAGSGVTVTPAARAREDHAGIHWSGGAR